MINKLFFTLVLSCFIFSCGDKSQSHSKETSTTTPSEINPSTEDEIPDSKNIPSEINPNTEDEIPDSKNTPSEINPSTEDFRNKARYFSETYFNTFVKYDNSSKRKMLCTLHEYFLRDSFRFNLYFTKVIKKKSKDPNLSENDFLNFIECLCKILFIKDTQKDVIDNFGKSTSLINFINTLSSITIPDFLPTFEEYENSNYLFSTKNLSHLARSDSDNVTELINRFIKFFPDLDKAKDFWNYFEEYN